MLIKRLIALIALALLWGTAAQAATVEPKVRLLVREKPTTSARIVDRVPAGKKLPLLGKNADGSWSRVDTGKHEGWVPSSQLKGKAAAVPSRNIDPDDGEEEVAERPAAPLAKKRGVRAEAWVSSSRYHDGENNKLTISSTKAELFGRPASGGTVVGVVRRGDVVDLVRRSGDRKWCLVDIGGGEVAWIDARNVRAGAFRAAPADLQDEQRSEEPEEQAPPPRRAPKEVVVADREPVEVERQPRAREETAEEAPPPPPPPPQKKSKRAPAPPPEETKAKEPEEEKIADAPSREDEAPPMTADEPVKSKKDKKRNKKLVKLASRDDSGVAMAARERSEETLVASPPGTEHGSNFIGVGARAGVAIINQRFTSNGTGALTNYDAATNAVGVQVGLAYTRAVGRTFRLGLDGSYEFAGAAGVRYHAADGSQVLLDMQNHVVDFGAQIGVHLRAIGGLELRLRLGGELMMDLIQGSAKAPLPSDRVLGMTIGAGIAAPNLLQLANRPVGAHLFGWALVPAQRAQTIGLEEGTHSSTIGATFGGGLQYGLYRGLSMGADYSYGFVLTRYTGTAPRNTSITAADRGNSQHLITLGLAYNY